MNIIYVITNKINGKQYVGKTTYSIEKRFKEHIYDSRKKEYLDGSRPLYSAFNKHGIENFSIEELERVSNENLLNEREKYWISKLNTYHYGYNATRGGDGQSYINKNKVLELYNQGLNTSEIAKILGHERASIVRILKEFNLKSNFTGKKPVCVFNPLNNFQQTFESRNELAQFFIDNNIGKAKSISRVLKAIRKYIQTQESYYGYFIQAI